MLIELVMLCFSLLYKQVMNFKNKQKTHKTTTTNKEENSFKLPFDVVFLVFHESTAHTDSVHQYMGVHPHHHENISL